MIFIVLGTQKFQFNRLLRQIDQFVASGQITEEIFAQKGNSDYEPQNYKFVDFLCKEEFDKKISLCSLLITHSGVGTIVSGINHGTPIIVVPRLQKYGEHVDNHQLEIAHVFSKKNYVLLCEENDDLLSLISIARNHYFDRYKSYREKTVDVIVNYLKKLR